jgi:tetratricopeptide (TPR) repeat protein
VVEGQTEQYVMLRNALLEMRDDSSAVMSLLTFQADNGAWWVEAANRELRAMLIEGRLDDADMLGGLVATVLEIQEGGAEDELAEHKLHREALRWLVEGIGAILEREPQLGIEQLENLTGALYTQESLQWVAWFWVSRAAAEVGDLERALEAGREALTLAEQLDDTARSTALRSLGELAVLSGDDKGAQGFLDQAAELFGQAGDEHGQATTHLARARMESAAGRMQEATDAALRAREADPEWDEPVLFLARQALISGNPRRAAAVLYPFLQREQPSSDVQREMRLVGLLQRGEVGAEVMGEFCRLAERAPDGETVTKLQGLVDQAPDFVPLREHLAWQLLKLGLDEDATAHFENLSARKLDGEVHSSVLLGLGCLANRRNRHRKTGARLHQAAAASRPSDQHPVVELPREEVVAGRQSRATSSGLPAVNVPLAEADADMDPAALAKALNQSTVQQEVGERDEMLEMDAAPPTPEAPSLDFTLWAEPDEEPDVSPAQVDGASTMRLSGEMLDSLTGSGAIPRTDSGAIRFDVGDPMPTLRSGDRPSSGSAAETNRGGSSARGAAKAAFTGDLQLLAVPDLLEFLKSSRRTGTLVVTSEAGIGAVNLKGGNITGAASPGSVNLGDILKRDGLVDEETLKGAAEAQSDKPEQLLGSILVARGVVDAGQVRKALTQQVQSAIIEMLHWQSGRFAFEPETPTDDTDGEIEIILDTQGVLLDALREFDEQNR